MANSRHDLSLPQHRGRRSGGEFGSGLARSPKKGGMVLGAPAFPPVPVHTSPPSRRTAPTSSAPATTKPHPRSSDAVIAPLAVAS